MSANCPRPRTGNGLDSPQSGIGNQRELSVDSPRTRIVQVPVLAMSSICPRPAIVRKPAASQTRRVLVASDLFPGRVRIIPAYVLI